MRTASPTRSQLMPRPPTTRRGRPVLSATSAPDGSPSPSSSAVASSRSTGRPVSSDSPTTRRPPAGTAIPINGPSSPPVMIPIAVPAASVTTTPIAAPAHAATSSRRPVTSPAAKPGHGGRKDHVEPEGNRVGDRAAEQDPRDRREVPGDEHGDHGRDPVAGDVDAADPLEVRGRQGERLVGEDVGHRRSLGQRDVADARGQRRAVQEVAKVQEEREDDDREPREAGGDVADGGELGRPREYQ